MNITFLIGNGFDLNLGLDTTYSDFVSYYKRTTGKTLVLEEFKESIVENEHLWSDAERELGQYTSKFEEGNAHDFMQCQEDFCVQLIDYLKNEEKRIDYTSIEDKVKIAFKKVNSITKSFPEEERTLIDNIYRQLSNQIIIFNFVCFNYTETLDKCLELIDEFGYHTYKGNKYNHNMGSLIHVHGTVDSEMIFGVNDETQIAKPEIFNCTDGDLYRSMLIKQDANKVFLQGVDDKVAKVIENSHIIYIYGMSLGETDKLWWNRICDWLNQNEERHLIVQKYDAPPKGAFMGNYKLFERRFRRAFAKNLNVEGSKSTNIENRIHITSENIFAEIKNVAKEKYANSIADILPAIV